MLLWLSLGLLVFTFALALIARASLVVLARLDLDPMAVLVWLGLAEWPLDRVWPSR